MDPSARGYVSSFSLSNNSEKKIPPELCLASIKSIPYTGRAKLGRLCCQPKEVKRKNGRNVHWLRAQRLDSRTLWLEIHLTYLGLLPVSVKSISFSHIIFVSAPFIKAAILIPDKVSFFLLLLLWANEKLFDDVADRPDRLAWIFSRRSQKLLVGPAAQRINMH